MTSDLILIAKKFSVPSAYGRRDGVRDFFAQYPDGVYIATDSGAPAGWEGYAVWFGGTGERYAERFMELIRDGYIVERFLRARVGGLLVFTFRCRLKMRRFGTLGKPYKPVHDVLNFYMPNGGTISLIKVGSPTVVELEYWLDENGQWTVWQPNSSGNRSLTLKAGQTVYIRNTSETSTGLNKSGQNAYSFRYDNDIYADGKVSSLLCKNPKNAVPSNSALKILFNWWDSPNLITSPILDFEHPEDYMYYYMFQYQNKINRVVTYMKTIKTNTCKNWLPNAPATGDFYCPAELTIPTGPNGIPSGWTRHDI